MRSKVEKVKKNSTILINLTILSIIKLTRWLSVAINILKVSFSAMTEELG